MSITELDVADTAGVDARAKLTRIDIDTHDSMVPADLYPYLPSRWRRYIDMIGLRQQSMFGLIVGAHPHAARADAWSPAGHAPGTDPEFFCEQLFGGDPNVVALLNPVAAQSSMWYGPGSPAELIREVQRAGNDFQRDKWLDFDSRIRGSVVVPYEDSKASVREIERLAPDDRFLHVLLPFRTEIPMGQERYWDIYEAAAAHDLPIAMHPAAQHTHTGSGWPSFYFENHAGFPASLWTQVASMVFEGVFDRFPNLQIVFVEGGFSWMPPLMWRLDRAWKQLREEVSHLEMAPSDYIRKHFWYTTQPIDEPEQNKHFPQLWDQLTEAGIADKIMFSSDYPHWDFDDPNFAIPRTLSDSTRRGIFVDNALGCYKRLKV